MKWKDALLLSNIPLEFEAAKLLVDQGFIVNSDFKYAWNESDISNNASVDIYAKQFISLFENQSASLQIELLIDCEHRSPKTINLFLPDPNLPQTSFVSVGHPIRIIDQFSPYVLAPESKTFFDNKLPICYKGMEIDMQTGNTNNTIINNGLLQLQNSLPRLLTENIFNFLTGPSDENIPFIFCPVFLTTSPLFVMKKDITLEQIENASEVHEVGEQTPFLIMYSDISPDFKLRCTNECSRLKDILRTDKAMAIEMKKARYYNSLFNLPFTIIDELIGAQYYSLNNFFTQFIICTNTQFPNLVDSLKQTAEAALKTQKKIE